MDVEAFDSSIAKILKLPGENLPFLRAEVEEGLLEQITLPERRQPPYITESEHGRLLSSYKTKDQLEKPFRLRSRPNVIELIDHALLVVVNHAQVPFHWRATFGDAERRGRGLSHNRFNLCGTTQTLSLGV